MTTTNATANTMQSFEDLIDLASERLGGAAIWCNDDFFAGMDNLVKSKEAVWDEHAYTDRGKWMDGWESKRAHRENDPDGATQSDVCVVRLGAPGIVRGVVVDTAFFRGNYPSHCSIDGAVVTGFPSAREIAERAQWFPLLDKVALQGNARNAFALGAGGGTPAPPIRVTHVRLRIFPDGGVARLRVHGDALPDWSLHGSLEGELDLASAELGASVVSCSDMFFGSRHNLLFPGLSGGMHDGWETRRSRRAGFDWAVIKLGAAGQASRIVVDTSHFKGNCPESFALDGAITAANGANDAEWTPLFPRTKLQPHTKHVFASGFVSSGAFSHVRLRVFPDGGVARFRLFGRVPSDEQQRQRVRRINAMSIEEANSALHRCCGSVNWAKHVSDRRPFADASALQRAIDEAFDAMTEQDWIEAFAAHPRIGQKVKEGSAESHEQSGMSAAADDVAARMLALNDEYLAKFGFIYIVMASGKTAREMLALLEQRINNDRALEIKNAAAEQRKITALRLQKVQ